MEKTIATSEIPPATTTATSLKNVGFGRRFLAYSIDGIILSFTGFVLGISLSFSRSPEVTNMAYFLGLLLGGAYFVFFWVKQEGQTLGNKLLAIRVVREDKKPLDVGTAVLRFVGYIISSIPFYLGLLWVAWDPKKQGWHDKIAKTIVIETGEKPKTGLAIAIVAIYYAIAALLMFFLLLAVIAGGFLLFNYAQKNPGALKNNQDLQQMMQDMEKQIGPSLSPAYEYNGDTNPNQAPGR